MEIETNLIKSGDGYAFQVPLALVRCKVLKHKKRYKLNVEEISQMNELSQKERIVMLEEEVENPA